MPDEKTNSVRQPMAWSTSQDGDYLLFYWKVLDWCSKGVKTPKYRWRTNYLEEHAYEYEPLDCHGREVLMEPPMASQFNSSPQAKVDRGPAHNLGTKTEELIADFRKQHSELGEQELNKILRANFQKALDNIPDEEINGESSPDPWSISWI